MSGLRAGAGRQRITPPVGIPLFSHLNPERMSEGVHDDLWAKVLVLEDGSLRAALVGLDLVWPMPENDYVKIRAAVTEATGIDGENIMVSCTHSHQGPVFDPHLIFNMSLRKQREVIDPWVESLPKMVAEAAKKATACTKEAKVSFGRTPITGLCYNRGKQIPEGIAPLINVDNTLNKFYFGDTPDMPRCIREQYVNWGMSPEEAAERAPLGLPDGPIDPDLDVIHITDKEGKTISVVVNFACHAVSCSPPVPRLISAGFPGFMASLVEEEVGGECLFTFGAGGDIRPYRSSARGFEEAQRVGFVLATGVMQAIRQAETVEKPELRVESETVQVASREYPSREESVRMVEEKRKLLAEAKADGRVGDAKRLNDEIDAIEYPLGRCGKWVGREDWMDRTGNIPLEVQAISIGGAVLLSLPNEVNVSIGLQIKEASWTKRLMLVTLANGAWMYLVKKAEYEEGRYEAAGCQLAPGAAEKLIATGLNLLERLKSKES